MKLSIIAPIYNVEKYVRNCILSIINQVLFNEVELIIVNDGTEDNSIEQIQDIVDKYANIKLINQVNQGLSMARNNGMSVATGDYVWFVDSDDLIAENCLGDICDRLFKNDLDGLYIASANIIDGRIERRVNINAYDGEVMSGIEAKIRGIASQPCAPFTIYKRSILVNNDIHFMNGVFHEDNEFTPRVYYYMKTVGIYSTLSYFVNQNPNSITRSINPKKSFDLIKVACSLDNFQKQVKNDEYAKYISREIVTVLNSSLLGTEYMDKDTLQKYRKDLFLNRGLYRHYNEVNDFKFKTEMIIFRVFPKYADCFYHFFNRIIFHRK